MVDKLSYASWQALSHAKTLGRARRRRCNGNVHCTNRMEVTREVDGGDEASRDHTKSVS